MNKLEEELKLALRRHDPPSDFVGRIMDRVNSDEDFEVERRPASSRILPFRQKSRVVVWLLAAAAAACLLVVFVTRFYLLAPGRRGGSGSDVVRAGRATQDQVAATQDTGVTAPPHDDATVPGPNHPGKGIDVASGPGDKRRRNRARRRDPGSYASREARLAEEQLRLALAITSATLEYAQRSIHEVDGTGTGKRDVNP